MKKYRRPLLTLLVSLIFSSNLYASCALTMGWEEWKPYQYLDSSNKLTGLDVELVENIFKTMKCKLSTKSMPWKRLLAEVELGTIDLVSGASINEERKTWAYFSEPYREESRVLFVLKGNSKKFPLNSIKDIVALNFRLGITRGEYNGPEFETLMKDANFFKMVRDVSKESINPKKLLSGRIDGFIGDSISVSQLLRNMNMLDKVEIHPLTIYSSGIYIMFSKKSTSIETLNAFNQSLNTIKDNGQQQSIIDKYLK